MANKNLDLLNIAKQQKQGGTTTNTVRKTPQPSNILAISQDVNYLESLINGDINENNSHFFQQNEQKVYDPMEEMKSIREGEKFNVQESKLPSAILKSLLESPLDMPTITEEQSIMDADTHNNVLRIMQNLEARDNGNTFINETTQKPETIQISNETNINYIENIIDKKFKELMSVIDSKLNDNTLKIMKLGDNFTFIDDNNNVYDCKLTYKGKAKTKKK
jgi:hypothetical protein